MNFIDVVYLFSAVYLVFLSMTVNVHSWLFKILYNVAPAILGFIMMAHLMTKFGWISL